MTKWFLPNRDTPLTATAMLDAELRPGDMTATIS